MRAAARCALMFFAFFIGAIMPRAWASDGSELRFFLRNIPSYGHNFDADLSCMNISKNVIIVSDEPYISITNSVVDNIYLIFVEMAQRSCDILVRSEQPITADAPRYIVEWIVVVGNNTMRFHIKVDCWRVATIPPNRDYRPSDIIHISENNASDYRENKCTLNGIECMILFSKFRDGLISLRTRRLHFFELSFYHPESLIRQIGSDYGSSGKDNSKSCNSNSCVGNTSLIVLMFGVILMFIGVFVGGEANVRSIIGARSAQLIPQISWLFILAALLFGSGFYLFATAL